MLGTQEQQALISRVVFTSQHLVVVALHRCSVNGSASQSVLAQIRTNVHLLLTTRGRDSNASRKGGGGSASWKRAGSFGIGRSSGSASKQRGRSPPPGMSGGGGQGGAADGYLGSGMLLRGYSGAGKAFDGLGSGVPEGMGGYYMDGGAGGSGGGGGGAGSGGGMGAGAAGVYSMSSQQTDDMLVVNLVGEMLCLLSTKDEAVRQDLLYICTTLLKQRGAVMQDLLTLGDGINADAPASLLAAATAAGAPGLPTTSATGLGRAERMALHKLNAEGGGAGGAGAGGSSLMSGRGRGRGRGSTDGGGGSGGSGGGAGSSLGPGPTSRRSKSKSPPPARASTKASGKSGRGVNVYTGGFDRLVSPTPSGNASSNFASFLTWLDSNQDEVRRVLEDALAKSQSTNPSLMSEVPSFALSRLRALSSKVLAATTTGARSGDGSGGGSGSGGGELRINSSAGFGDDDKPGRGRERNRAASLDGYLATLDGYLAPSLNSFAGYR